MSEGNRRYKLAHLGAHLAVGGVNGSGCGGGGRPTFAVVGEVQQEGLEAARVGSELVPDDGTQEDHGDVVLHLQATRLSPWLQMQAKGCRRRCLSSGCGCRSCLCLRTKSLFVSRIS